MGKIPLLEEERAKNLVWIGPKYYDYPDGEDLTGKLKFAAIVGSAAGVMVGAGAANGVPKIPKSLTGKLFKTVQYFVPCFGVAMVFTTVTYYSTRLRKKDDELNYVIGGLAAGLFLRAVTNYQAATLGYIVFPTLAFFKKHSMKHDINMFAGKPKTNLPAYFQRKWDTSLTQERKGNWVRE